MPKLPFLVVHGAMVWKLLLVGIAAGLFAHARTWLRLRGALIFTGFFTLFAYLLLRAVSHDLSPSAVSATEISAFGEVSIAAALPDSRGAALRAIYDGTTRNLSRDDAGLQLGVWADRFVNQCPDRRLVDAGRYDEALDAARACDPGELTPILLQLGRYGEASAAADRVYMFNETVRADIGAGRWADAAKSMEGYSLLQRSPAAGHCVALYLATLAGEPSALARLTEDTTPLCGVLVHAIRGEVPSTPGRELATALGAEPEHSSDLFSSLIHSLDDHGEVWPSSSSGAGDERHAVVGADRRAFRAILLGDFAAARTELARPVSSEVDDFSRRELQVLLAVRSGWPLPSSPMTSKYDRFGEELRRGTATGSRIEELDGPGSDGLPDAMVAARRGNGAPLAAILRAGKVIWSSMGLSQYLAAVAPSVVSHRAELADAVRNFQPASFWERAPFKAVEAAALHRDASRLLGDDAEAARWQTIIDRHAAMLADRNRVIAFIALDEI